jgi:glycosyltransferase involved in cell wall biosynthesis
LLLDRISIIIPVYNVEAYLRRCLDSVINQTHTNLEIICVDDGSTDNSGSICDEYAERDSRIRVFHKKNGGVSSARNVGLDNFTSDYLGFVDADDQIEPYMYKELYSAMISEEASLSAVNFTRNGIVETPREPTSTGIFTRNEMLLYAIRNVHYAGFGRIVCNKLFYSRVIRDNKMKFDESLKIAEDFRFLAELLLYDKLSGVFVDKPLYHYLRRDNSLMCSQDYSHSLDELRSYKEISTAADNIGLQSITIWLKRQHCYNASLLLEKALRQNDTNLVEVLQNELFIYARAYIESNSEYPERIERINKMIMEAGIEKSNPG